MHVSPAKQRRWDAVKKWLREELKRCNGDVRRLAVNIGEPDTYDSKRKLTKWLNDAVPSWEVVYRLEELGKIDQFTEVQISDDVVKRKAEIVANHLEPAVALMNWFIDQATEDQRDMFRSTLGTDLSYDAFMACRALLTEDHHKRVMEEKK